MQSCSTRPGRTDRALSTVAVAGLALVLAAPASAQAPDSAVADPTPRMSVTWTEVPIRDALMAFSLFSGKSIVAGPGVTGFVTATINAQPWDVALRTILSTQGLIGREDESGIIRVDALENLNDREAIEPILTRAYRISFAPAAEIQAALEPLLSERGSMSVSPSTNTIVISDVARVHEAIAGVIRER